MAASSSAEVVWQGDLSSGSGQVKPESGAYPALPVSFPVRARREAGKTSPEELLASAHASCYAMALAAVLGKAGKPPERLVIRATAEFDAQALKVTTMTLVIRANLPGVDGPTFERMAKEAEGICPISNAIRGNVEVRLEARLE